MSDEVRAPPGAQHSDSLKAITARQLQALVRRTPIRPDCPDGPREQRDRQRIGDDDRPIAQRPAG